MGKKVVEISELLNGYLVTVHNVDEKTRQQASIEHYAIEKAGTDLTENTLERALQKIREILK